jgi:hypothetical protein
MNLVVIYNKNHRLTYNRDKNTIAIYNMNCIHDFFLKKQVISLWLNISNVNVNRIIGVSFFLYATCNKPLHSKCYFVF